MKGFPFEGVFAIVLGTMAVIFNKQLAQACRKSQKAFWGLDFDVWEYRIPLYLGGGLFLSFGIYRLFLMDS